MMGNHSRSESLFYYFRLEDLVPENHLLRLIDRHISFDFVRAKLKDSYSETGRPSIDPELLLRMLLIGYLYGAKSFARSPDGERCKAAASRRTLSGTLSEPAAREQAWSTLHRTVCGGPARSCATIAGVS